MKTTVDIPEQVLAEAMRYTRAKTKREAIVTAIEDFNRRKRMAELVKYSGTSDTLLSNEQIEDLEKKRLRRLEKLGA
jgi:Arc/MetJ family transcription regulator